MRPLLLPLAGEGALRLGEERMRGEKDALCASVLMFDARRKRRALCRAEPSLIRHDGVYPWACRRQDPRVVPPSPASGRRSAHDRDLLKSAANEGIAQTR